MKEERSQTQVVFSQLLLFWLYFNECVIIRSMASRYSQGVLKILSHIEYYIAVLRHYRVKKQRFYTR